MGNEGRSGGPQGSKSTRSSEEPVDVDHAASGDGVGHYLANRRLHLDVVTHTMGCVGAAPSELDRNGLEKRQIVPEPQRLGRGHGKREGLRGYAGTVHEPVSYTHLRAHETVLDL